MSERLFISTWSAESERTAVLAQECDSLWLYLTEPGQQAPSFACWVLNLPEAPEEPELEVYEARSDAPPAPRAWIEAEGVQALRQDGWTFSWGPGGHSVAISLDDDVLAVIGTDPPNSFARYLTHDGPWGNAWDDVAAAAVFGIEIVSPDGGGEA